jgi:HEPN domain-containing protein/predicted nucleotidyltransferase
LLQGGLSGEAVREMLRRAGSFLRSAALRIDWGDYDLACYDVEQALQLYLKAVLLELFGVETRAHGVLEHLSILRRELAKAGHNDLVSRLSDLVRDNRVLIDLIDTSYIEARYSAGVSYAREDAKASLDFAEKLAKLLEEVRAKVKSSGGFGPAGRLGLLMKWRDYIDILGIVIKETMPGCKAYIVGGAAEDRLTARSDIDVLIACPDPPTRARDIAITTTRIREALEKRGVEWAYLLEFHIVDEKLAEKILSREHNIRII